MIVLAFQIGLAVIASMRGWGFTPFGLIIILAVTGFFVGAGIGMNQATVAFLVTLDWIVLILLVGAAIFAPEKVDSERPG